MLRGAKKRGKEGGGEGKEKMKKKEKKEEGEDQSMNRINNQTRKWIFSAHNLIKSDRDRDERGRYVYVCVV